MEPLDTLRAQFDRMDQDAKRTSLIALAVYAFLVVVGYRQLAKTTNRRLQGPRWLWKALMPSSYAHVSEAGVTVVPIGVIAFWLLGRRRKK